MKFQTIYKSPNLLFKFLTFSKLSKFSKPVDTISLFTVLPPHIFRDKDQICFVRQNLGWEDLNFILRAPKFFKVPPLFCLC